MNLIKTGKFKAISCSLGTFSKASIDKVMKIRDLIEVSDNVKDEIKWFSKTIEPPNESCHSTKNELIDYRNFIPNTPDGHAFLDYNKTILASDMATLADKKWLSQSTLLGLPKLLNEQNKKSEVVYLNDLLRFDKKSATNQLKDVCKDKPKYLTSIMSVGKSQEVFLSTLDNHGCHWTILFGDLTANE